MLKRHCVQPDAGDPTTWESIECILETKCRQCDHCLRKRRIHWWHRAKWETTIAPRTWFATFTYSPENAYKNVILAGKRCKRLGLDYDALPAEQQFAHLVAVAGEDLTLFFKRVRKEAKGPLRYLIVSEAHKSGLPHFHALIHETIKGAAPYAILKSNWPCGHSAFKLADPKAVSYVAKYISKDARCRVRASVHYGSADTAYAIASPTTGVDAKQRREEARSVNKKIVTGKSTDPSND